MMGLAVAGLMTMVSCRKPNVNDFNTTGEKITFSATIDNGSKTTLVNDVIVWSYEDQISINGVKYTLLKGLGETSGEFVGGDVEAVGGKYFASYPYSDIAGYENNGSSVKFNIPETFTLAAQIPMVAYTNDKGGGLGFKSMVNVLALSLKGTQSLTDIVVSSTEKLSGDFTVTVSNELANPGIPTVADGGTTRTIHFPEALKLDPSVAQQVNVVLPVFGIAESKVIVEFIGEAGSMTVGPFVLKAANLSSESFATTPNHRYTMDVVVSLENWEASVATIPVCAVHSKCASSGGVVTGTGVEEQGVCWGTSANPTIAGSHYVHQYEYANGSLTPKNESDKNTFTGFMSGLSAGTPYYVRAYIKKGSNVKYGDDITFTTPLTEPFPTDQTVNFGLEDYPSLEWSKYNLGVDPKDLDEAADWYGDYYQWGDNAASTGKTVNCYKLSYRFGANSTMEFTKYCPSNSTDNWYSFAGTPVGTPDNKLLLDDDDDCVRQTLDGGWRMPTADEWQKLYNGTLLVLTSHYDGKENLKGYVVYKVKDDGHKMQVVTSDDGNGGYAGYSESEYTLDDVHMFLPAAGARSETSLYYVGFSGNYWSGSLYSDGPHCAYCMHFNSTAVGPQTDGGRFNGLSVRPVKDK